MTKTDIARAAGVSRTCVSLVLNDRPGVRIAAATRRRVLEVARRLGYQDAPSSAESAGHARPLSAIAYVLCTGGQPPSQMCWHMGVLEEIQRRTSDDDRCVIFMSCTDASAALRKVLRDIDRAGPLGVILDGVVSETLVEQLQQRRMPFVVTGITPFAHEPAWTGKVNTVSVDVQDGVRRLMRWLAEHGGRSIAFACDGLHLLVNRLSVQAYQEAVRELGLTYHPALVQVCSADVDRRHLLLRFHELGIEYDGLLIGSLALAHTMLTPAAELQVAGATDSSRPPLVATIGPGGTGEPAPPDAASVYVRYADYTRLAYDLLAMRIKYPDRKPQHLQMQMTFHDPTRSAGR